MTQANPHSSTFDAIVVGAGACGGLAAELLCKAGLSVLVLDAGWTPSLLQAPLRRTFGTAVEWLADPSRAQSLPALVVKVGRRAMRLVGRFRQPVQMQCYAWEMGPSRFVDDADFPYVADPQNPFAWIRSHGVGGRMVVPGHGRQYYRFGAAEFAPTDGLSPAWPLAPRELDPWYGQVEDMLRLSGACDGVDSIPDSRIAQPITAEPFERAVMHEVAARWPTVRPILSRYASPMHSIERAQATGRMTLRSGAVVRQVLVSRDERVEGVVFHDARTKAPTKCFAPVVVLAASAIESTRILLLSNGASGEPFGATLDALGRNLMDHVMIKAEGFSPPKADQPPPGDAGRCVYLPRFDQRGESSPGARGYGVQLYHYPMHGEVGFTAVAFAEMTPRPENRVTLDPSRTDAFGSPLLAIACAYDEPELQQARRQTEALRELADLLGVRLTRLDTTPSTPGSAVHECGTARMGLDPATSVLDRTNQVWGAKGLYVTDASSFPSQGAQNPTLTAMALTARACGHVLGSVDGTATAAAQFQAGVR